MAPSGKKILLLERGASCSVSSSTGTRPRGCSSRTATFRPTRGATPRARCSSPGVHYFVGGAAPRCTTPTPSAFARKTSARSSHHDGVSPALADQVRRPRALLHEGREALLTSTACAAPTRPSPAPASAYPLSAEVAHEPRIQELSDRRLTKLGLPPVPRAVRHPSRRNAERARAAPASSATHVRRLPMPGAREGRRRGGRASAPRSRMPT